MQQGSCQQARRPWLQSVVSSPDTVPVAGTLPLAVAWETATHHLARLEDQGCGLGLPDTHDDRSKTLQEVTCTIESVQA